MTTKALMGLGITCVCILLQSGMATSGAQSNSPAAPSAPNPASGSAGVTVTPNLSWASAGATSYSLLLGTASPPSPYVSNLTTSWYPTSPLTPGTTYYWQVVASNSSSTTPGPVWSFTTAGSPATTPQPPGSPNPASGGTGVTVTPNLSWTSAGATSYDLLLGTTSPPPAYVSNLTTSWYPTTPLAAGTTYYWQVVASNSSGTTPGQVWSFTTAGPSPTTTAPAVSTPYTGTFLPLPGTFPAVNFDNGGEGVAYSDTTPGNSGGQYRSTDVDIQNNGLGGYDVGWIADGEWLNYSVNVAMSGTYTIVVQVASPLSAGRLHVRFGTADSVPVSIPNTGGWQNWTIVTLSANLMAGPQIMKLMFDVGGFNVAGVTVAYAPATLIVAAGGDFQAALNAANPGDTILLQAGATFVGNFVLPVKTGDAVITIRSSAPDASLPASNVRIDPSYAPMLPKLQSPSIAAPLSTAAGAHDYRLMFLEFLGNPTAGGDLLDLGDGSLAQNSLALVPYGLSVDRIYMHGDPVIGQKRAISLNSASTTIQNSYIGTIMANGQDSQAIAGWNGPGPYAITNNYLEAAGENIIFGGDDPAIPLLVPSDITITDNHLSKQLAWKSQPAWNVKNLFELKNAQRVVVDGNVMEFNWLAAQSGYAVLFTPRNQNGTAPWSVVQQVQFTNNVVQHVSAGINILGTDYDNPSQELNTVVIRNNLFVDVSSAKYGGNGSFVLIEGGVSVTIDHNTVFEDGLTAVVAGAPAAQGLVFTNNIIPDNSWAIIGTNTAPGNATIAAYFPSSMFLDNIFIGSNPAVYPSGNFYPGIVDEVGFVDVAGGDYQLSPSSIYRGAGSDGTDVGYNIEAQTAAMQ